MTYSPFVLGMRWVFFHGCAVVTCASLLANFLPDAKMFAGKPKLHSAYCFLVDYVALFALNFRIDLPSLDQEWMGFRRRMRHAYRNWKQGQQDLKEPQCH